MRRSLLIPLLALGAMFFVLVGTFAGVLIAGDSDDDSSAAAPTATPARPAATTTQSTPRPGTTVTPTPGGESSNQRLGASFAQITPLLQRGFGLTRSQGVVIISVLPGGAAERAGLARGDIILAMNGSLINTISDLSRAVLKAPVDETVDLQVLRASTQTTVRMVMPAQSTLEGLDGLLPDALIDKLQEQLDDGTLTPAQLQQFLRLYQARGDNVRVGVVKSVEGTTLTVTDSTTGADVAVSLRNSTFTGDAAFRRGAQTIQATDLQAGETVMILSLDGGVSALTVYAYGILN